LHFLCSENAGPLTPGEPYIAWFPDSFGNVKTREVERPDIISQYFKKSNVIDKHNQLRQGILKLKKAWIMRCAWFCINTTGLGMTVTDAFLLVTRSEMKVFKGLTIREFAGMMAWDLFYNIISVMKELFPASSRGSIRPVAPAVVCHHLWTP